MIPRKEQYRMAIDEINKLYADLIPRERKEVLREYAELREL